MIHNDTHLKRCLAQVVRVDIICWKGIFKSVMRGPNFRPVKVGVCQVFSIIGIFLKYQIIVHVCSSILISLTSLCVDNPAKQSEKVWSVLILNLVVAVPQPLPDSSQQMPLTQQGNGPRPHCPEKKNILVL